MKSIVFFYLTSQSPNIGGGGLIQTDKRSIDGTDRIRSIKVICGGIGNPQVPSDRQDAAIAWLLDRRLTAQATERNTSVGQETVAGITTTNCEQHAQESEASGIASTTPRVRCARGWGTMMAPGDDPQAWRRGAAMTGRIQEVALVVDSTPVYHSQLKLHIPT